MRTLPQSQVAKPTANESAPQQPLFRPVPTWDAAPLSPLQLKHSRRHTLAPQALSAPSERIPLQPSDTGALAREGRQCGAADVAAGAHQEDPLAVRMTAVLAPSQPALSSLHR